MTCHCNRILICHTCLPAMNGKKRKRVESNEIVRGPTMCFRQKQQARILSGLRFLKAPTAFWLSY